MVPSVAMSFDRDECRARAERVVRQIHCGKRVALFHCYRKRSNVQIDQPGVEKLDGAVAIGEQLTAAGRVCLLHAREHPRAGGRAGGDIGAAHVGNDEL